MTGKFRKSSFSGGNSGSCVELAWTPRTGVVRDSKNPSGPTLLGDIPSLIRLTQHANAARADRAHSVE